MTIGRRGFIGTIGVGAAALAVSHWAPSSVPAAALTQTFLITFEGAMRVAGVSFQLGAVELHRHRFDYPFPLIAGDSMHVAWTPGAARRVFPVGTVAVPVSDL